ncbi:MAG TPA: aminotransferase class V-fold PLP-dependent enzyme [Clostridiales bacterium]|nr:aminotransferase class V-fold PLP-dependent enzyme [Clostridiales bacterium]
MSDTPLFSAIKNYIGLHRARCHTPGHSGRAGALKDFAAVLPFDVTEIDGLDSLYDADGPILEAEKLTAKLFGCRRTLFSAGGCTLAIQTMLSLVGGKIAFGRNLHRSAVSAAALLGIEPVWLYPENGVITPQTVKSAFEKHPDLSGVYITSPDYYGRMCDIKSIADICHRRGAVLMVDNAHGSHLRFFTPSLHPVSLGADLVACSTHKTLPVLTGGAWLHINNEKFIGSAKAKMALFGSTSPSYLIMASLDVCRHWLETHGQGEFERLKQVAKALKTTAQNLGLGFDFDNCDPTRLTLDTGKLGISGKTAAQILFENGISAEYSDLRYCVLILTPFHTQEEIKSIENALLEIGRLKGNRQAFEIPPLPRPTAAMDLRQAVLCSAKTVPINQSLGKIAAQPVSPCPPGIPAVIPGEIICEGTLEYLGFYGIKQVEVIDN